MRVLLDRIDGLSLTARSDSNHPVTIDTKKEQGGNETGATPMELMLMGVAGCTAMDVISFLEKRRVELSDFRIEAEAERAEEHPRKFTKIHIRYILEGQGIRQKDVERGIKLSEEKYCSAIASLSSLVEFTSDYVIS